jgi:hypothetical protein
MGMFDTIHVSDQLPFNDEMKELGLDARKYSLQTKDFENCMVEYVLQDGMLYIKKYEKTEWVDGDPKGKSFLDRLGYLHRDGEFLEPTNYHGEIVAYTYENDVMNKWDCWVEFKLKFTSGKLVEKELTKFEKTDNAERKQREKEFMDTIKVENAKFINRFFFHTAPYRSFAFYARKVLYKISSAINRFASKL